MTSTNARPTTAAATPRTGICVENVGAAPTCRDKNECTQNHGGCDALTSCTDLIGSRTCGACPTGYMGTGETGCSDVNECAQGNGGCDPLTKCHNTTGSRTCDPCPSGYTGTGETGCTDYNECSQANGGCGAATCNNQTGAPPLCSSTHYRWAPNNVDTVLDTTTGLTWQRKVTENAPQCGGDPYCTQGEGLLYCVNLSVGGYSDWRLPSQTELEGLIVSGVDPAIDSVAFPNTPSDYYWSSSVVDMDPTYGWVCNFAQANSTAKANVRDYRVRCVR